MGAGVNFFDGCGCGCDFATPDPHPPIAIPISYHPEWTRPFTAGVCPRSGHELPATSP
jgi:hypothetical protein